MKTKIANEIQVAMRAIIKKLLEDYREQFYYLTLVTTGEAHCPVFSAWSKEMLDRAKQNAEDTEEAEADFKWSYADSPLLDFGSENFQALRTLLDGSEFQSASSVERRLEVLLGGMELGLKQSDAAGAFHELGDRNKFILAAEVMPPDPSNTDRVKRLNPASAIEEWLQEAAE